MSRMLPGKDGLRQLAQTLREPLPEGFEWNYFKLKGCAIGLCRTLWDWEYGYASSAWLCDYLEISWEQGDRIFFNFELGMPVTPGMVAEEIESILREMDCEHPGMPEKDG